MKHLFLTVSVLTLISSPSFATWQQDVKDQVNLETGQNKVIQKLMKSQDYTIDLDEGALVNTITEVVAVKNRKEKGRENLKSEDISFETRHQIVNTLDGLKTSHAPLGNGYYLTKNRHNDLCVESGYSILVYPTQKENREKYNAFYPVTYKGNFLSQPLYEEIDRYTKSKGLSGDQTKRLYKYLEPLFFIVKEEMGSLLTGLPKSKGWVYSKGYEGTLSAIKRQTDHHLYLTKSAKVTGLDSEEVSGRLVSDLLDKGLSLIPSPSREIYRSGGKIYTLGLNHNGHLSLLHPYVEDLPYPVFSEHRGRGNMNLPKGFEDSPALRKQWDRVGDFVRVNEDISPSEKTRSIILLEPVGYLFNKYLKNFHVSRSDYPEQHRAEDEIVELARIFSDAHHIPMPFLDMFYQGKVNIHSVLSDLQRRNAYHLYLTDDLWPQRLSPQKERLTHELLNYLVFKDIQDRFKEFYQYAGSRLDRLQTALN